MTASWTGVVADAWGMHGDDIGWGWMVVMMIGMLLFWAAIILGVVWLVRGSFEGWRDGRRETALETLDRRFAEGAMSVDEYHERREVIATSRQPDQGVGRPQPG